jgi:gliding motility-associated-like protein
VPVCYRRLIYIFLCCVIAIASQAQDFSNKGKDFWLAYTGHIDGQSSRMALYITGEQATTGTVQFTNGTNIPFTVIANQTTVVQIYPGLYPVYNSSSDLINSTGIRITAARPVVVYAHILNSARSGASLILPAKTLGKRYKIAAYDQINNAFNSARSEFAIVAIQNQTTIEITPSENDINNNRTKGVPFLITLNKGEVYQYQSLKDLTGSEVRAISVGNIPCKPIAVFSGSTWNAFDCTNPSGGDNLYQQLFPVTAWGKQFVTAPFINRQPYDILRIIVDDTLTQVTVNGTLLNPAQLIKKSYYEIKDALPKVISTSKPVMVVQYMISQSCDSRNVVAPGAPIPYPADPEMTILNPIEQTLNRITVLSARKDLTPPNTNIEQHYINIIIKDSYRHTLTIDGQLPTSSFVSIPGSGYSYLQENVTTSTATNPTHRLSADSGFVAIAYGYGEVESYGYLAGADIKDLNQFISFSGPAFNQAQNAVCVADAIPFSLTIPYTTAQIIWSYGNNNSDTLYNPIPDSSYIRDNKTLYVYKAPTIINYTTPGTYTIKTAFSNPNIDECGTASQERELDIEVFGKPISRFTLPPAICINDSITLSDSSNGSGRPITNWYWQLGNGQTATLPIFKTAYNSAGMPQISLVTSSDLGCVSDTTKKTIQVFDLPIAQFTITDTLCKDKPVVFTDASNGMGATIVSWQWNFGDGVQRIRTTGDTVQHQYTTPGTYTATLTVTTSTGCKSRVASRSFTIHPLPQPAFRLPNICLPDGRGQFFDESTIADNTEAGFRYSWVFNDPRATVSNPNTSTLQNPVHRFDTVMTYPIQLTIYSAAHCTATTTRLLNTIYPQPKAGFTVTPSACLNDTARFTDTSLAAAQTITRWRWSFGDNQTDTIANPVHQYALPGNYTTRLFVYTDKGCVSDTFATMLTIHPLPTADFLLNNPGCVQRDLTFSNQSIANAGQLTQGLWYMGEGTTLISTANAPIRHHYTDTGSYTVTLRTVTSNGCFSPVTARTIRIYNNPVANFILPEVCLNDAFASFTDSSHVVGNSQINQYYWRFADPLATPANPDTSIVRNPSHRYGLAAVYPVTLTATTNRGCRDTITKDFTVNGAIPIAGLRFINGDTVCSSTPLIVEQTATVNFGAITRFSIDWDDPEQPGFTETDEQPYTGKRYQHQYPIAGQPLYQTRQLRIRAWSGITCVDERLYAIVLKKSPQLYFTLPDTVCSNIVPYTFTYAGDTAGLPGKGIYSGPGIRADGKFDPARAGAGTHTISYTYTGSTGCAAIVSNTITVLQAPTADAGPDKTIAEGTSTMLNGYATGTGLQYQWTPPTFLSNPNSLTPVAAPTDDQQYRLRITADNKCTASDSVKIIVWKSVKLPNAFTPNGDGVNDIFRVVHARHVTSMTLMIYNRWGQQVFVASGVNRGWDGTFAGRPAEGGTYSYILTYHDLTNTLQTVKGTVLLIR